MELIQRTFRAIFCCLILLISIRPVNVFAGWSGPQAIIQGMWGTGDDQFGITSQDTSDFIPNFNVTTEQKVVIRDGTNRRVKIYNFSGALELIELYKTNLSYKDLTIADSYGFSGDFVGYGEGGVNYFYRADQKVYIHFSPTGQLLQTYTSKPLELGKVKEKSLGGGKYKVTVKYPDKEWGIIGKSAFPKYMRDLNGNLYGVGDTQVARFNDCGRELARLAMPENIREEMSSDQPGAEPISGVIEEYGRPVLASNGDVYTWKSTADTYSILKWTWQDDANAPANAPDAPTNLIASASTTGITLTWKASPQDPGCVTGYEIGRSETAGGPYTALGTINKGIFKYEDTTVEAGKTYYYKIRAMFGSAYSEYSNEASGSKK